MLHKIKKTFEMIRNKGLKQTMGAIYYYFTIKIKKTRKLLLYKYIQGNGIEIGGLDNPAPINKNTTQVKYVDYLDKKDLEKNHPHLKNKELGKIDYICKADNLDKIKSNSQDFIIANHLLEHLENPIKALLERYRVLKDKGIIFMAIPDKRKTRDHNRKRTKLEHIISDFIHPSKARNQEHYLDFAQIHLSDLNLIEKEAKRLESINFSIHYHVFIEEDVLAIIERCNSKKHTKFNIIHIKHTTKNPADNEFIIILQAIK